MPTEPAPVVEPARRVRLLRLLVLLAAGTLVVDQLTKAWAIAALSDGVARPLLGALFGLRLVFNSGAALSLGTGMTGLLTLVACAVVVVVVRTARRLGSTGWAVALGLLLGGALGNLVDRFLRAPGPGRGHVVDFLAYADWFVGNVADIAIVLAAVLLTVLAGRGVRPDGTREGDRRSAGGDGAQAATDVVADPPGDASDRAGQPTPPGGPDA